MLVGVDDTEASLKQAVKAKVAGRALVELIVGARGFSVKPLSDELDGLFNRIAMKLEKRTDGHWTEVEKWNPGTADKAVVYVL